MQNEKLVVQLPDGSTELTIREGKAPDMLPVKEQKIISISGDIKTIGNYARVRLRDGFADGTQKIDINKAIVEMDKTAQTIVLRLDPENHYGAIVTGTLLMNDDLIKFGINTEKMYSRTALHKLIRFSKPFFDDSDKHKKLVAALQSVKLKTSAEIEQTKNQNAGSHKTLSEKTVTDRGDLPDSFKLKIPIFKGFDPICFDVDICLQTNDVNGEMQFWLESPQIHEHLKTQIDKIFEDELAELPGFVVVNK